MHGGCDNATGSRPRLGRTAEIAAVSLLLILYFGLVLGSTWNQSPAIDEVSHLTAGVSYWRTGDLRLNSEQGKFPQAWVALPVAFGPFKFPSLDQEAWWHSDEWALGHQFFFGVGNDAQSLLRRGRAMVAILGMVLGLLVYFWSRRLFGVAGGIVSLVAYTFSPPMLAHGGLTTSDMALALALTLAVGAWWIVLHRVTPWTVLASALAAALVFVTKASAFILIPMGLLLLVIRLATGRPLPMSVGRTLDVGTRRRQLLVFGGVGVVHLAVVVLVIWACFGFRFSPFKNAEPGRDAYGESWQELLANRGAAAGAIAWARDHRVLPDAYLWGIAEAHLRAGGRKAFLAGHYSLTGWWYFFPFCMLVKTPLWLWGLLGLSLAAGIRGCSKRLPDETRVVGPEKWTTTREEIGGRRGSRPSMAETMRFPIENWRVGFHPDRLYDIAPLLVLLAVYGAVLLKTHLNIGHRHALALYPALLILVGGSGAWFAAAGTARRAGGTAVGFLLVTSLVTALWAWPDYLAYFNLASGGSARGYRLLVDSSSDWGQELPALKRWLNRNVESTGTTPVYFSYFGVGSPEYYGIKARPIPRAAVDDPSRVTELKAGIYCVSATMLQTIYIAPMGKWCRQYEDDYQAGLKWLKEIRSEPQKWTTAGNREVLCEKLKLHEELQFARLAAFLRHREPDDQVAHGILVYRLDDGDLDKALHGAPAELHDTNEVQL